MIKTILLVITPAATWTKIVAAQRGIFSVLLFFLLPLLLLSSAVEGYGLHKWGKTQDNVARIKLFSVRETVGFEAAQILLTLLVIFFGAQILKSMAETFRGRNTFKQTFTVAAYGLGPLILLRMLNAFPGTPLWLPCFFGIFFSASILYQGIPLALQPDPPHAFGLYMMSTIFLALASSLMCLLSAWYLLGKFPQAEALFNKIGA